MLIIYLLLISILISLILTSILFYKVGRQNAFEHLSKHYEDAYKIIGQQDILIKAYRQRIKSVTDIPTNIFEPVLLANDFVESLKSLMARYGNKMVLVNGEGVTGVTEKDDSIILECEPDQPLFTSEIIIVLINIIMQKYGNIKVTSSEKNLLSITYNKEADKFFINS